MGSPLYRSLRQLLTSLIDPWSLWRANLAVAEAPIQLPITTFTGTKILSAISHVYHCMAVLIGFLILGLVENEHFISFK